MGRHITATRTVTLRELKQFRFEGMYREGIYSGAKTKRLSVKDLRSEFDFFTMCFAKLLNAQLVVM